MTDIFPGDSLLAQSKKSRLALIFSAIGLSFSLFGVGGIFSAAALALSLVESRRGKLSPTGTVALVLSLVGLSVAVTVTVYMGVIFLMMKGYIDSPEFSALLESLLERAGSAAP